ncbi:MAG: T9SS type A sorting domain-containing protein [Flavobacteriales bacterium]|nr:T9SS type A sorting domain-containing protein [Flavobacteriales bacterium]
MIRNLSSLTLFLLIQLYAFSQPTFFFEGNNFRWAQTTNGSLFNNRSQGLPGLEVPAGEGNHSVFTSTIWLGGVSPSGDLKIAFHRHCQDANEMCNENWGPLKLNGAANSTEDVSEYNRVWFITSAQIDEHQYYFDCFNDSNCDVDINFPDYEIPEAFLTWPAEGAAGYADHLAPYVDRNNDGVYTPTSGDHPAICGDFSTYFIWNTLGLNSLSENISSIGLEIHTSVYGYESESEAEFNTLFVQYKLINRDNTLTNDTYSAICTDLDLGNPIDDYIASDVGRSMFYVYNGDSFDEQNFSGPGYADDLPAFGVKILGGVFADDDGLDTPLNQAFYGNETTGYNDGIIDNERLGLSNSIFYAEGVGPAFMQAPQTPIEYYNYMNSRWRDGLSLSYGGTGYGIDNLSTRYHFSGGSDPLFVGTDGTDPNYTGDDGWTEQNEAMLPGERRMLGSSGPFTFAPGDIQYIDLAYIFARDSYDDNETEIETLQRFADEVEGRQCEPLPSIILGDKSLSIEQSAKVYPNPTNDQFTVDLELTAADRVTIEMVNVVGQIVKTIDLGNRSVGLNRAYIDINDLSEGIYFINLLVGDAQETIKLQILR